MFKIKWCGLVLAVLFSAGAKALTFEQLAEKNARFIELKADLAIAKIESELALQRARTQLGTAPERMNGDTNANRASPAPKAAIAAPAEDRDIFLNSIHGNAGKLVADFRQQALAVSRRQGELIFDGWKVASIAYPDVTLVRSASNGIAQPLCKLVSVGSSVARGRPC